MWLSFKKSKRKASRKPRKSRKVRKSKKSKRASKRKSRRSSKRKSRRSFGKRKMVRRSRKFGAAKGPGFQGATSFQNGYSNYFGAPEPFVNASEWFYPNPGSSGGMIGSGKTNYQSPNMLKMYSYGRKKY
jgi:hypothetical protein